MNFKLAIAALLLSACTAATALVPSISPSSPGIGTDGSLTWEQLRFYGPSGASSTTYAAGQPTTLATVLGVADLCADANICGSTLRFDTRLGGTLTASASTTARGTVAIVKQDLKSNYGGLGVQGYMPASSTTHWVWNTKTKSKERTEMNKIPGKTGSYKTTATAAAFFGKDEINAGDSLTLTFQNPVRVLGFDFSDGSHRKSRLAGDFFGLAVNGGPKMDYSFMGGFPFNTASTLLGTTFTFSFASHCAEDFYLGAIKFAQVVAAPVPEAATLSMLVAGLVMVAGLGRKQASRVAKSR